MGFIPQTGRSSIAAPVQHAAVKLASAGNTIGVASGWQTITDGSNPLTCACVARSGSRIKTTLTGSFAVLVGGNVRVVINGGAFSNAVITIEPSTLGIGTHKVVQNGWIDIANAGTYTITAQAQGVGLAASITPAAATQYNVEEWPQ